MWQAVGSDIWQANEMTGELRCKTPQQKLERNPAAIIRPCINKSSHLEE